MCLHARGNPRWTSPGCPACSMSHCFSSSSRILPRLPNRVFRLITRASRKAIDRRVGDLAEILPEKMVQAAILVRQHGQRRVVAHRAGRFLAVLHHRLKNQLQILDACSRHATWRRRNASPAKRRRARRPVRSRRSSAVIVLGQSIVGIASPASRSLARRRGRSGRPRGRWRSSGRGRRRPFSMIVGSRRARTMPVSEPTISSPSAVTV